jgi:sugar (pentulose or hexulose) kinase
MKAFDKQLGNIEPGSNATTAFLGPSFVHPANTNVRSGGLMFPVPISLEPPDRIDIVRAALDNFAFAIRYNVERLNSFCGPALNIAVGGGMIRTNTFRTILANVLDCEIGIAESGETTALGTLSQVAASVDTGPSLAEYAAISCDGTENVRTRHHSFRNLRKPLHRVASQRAITRQFRFVMRSGSSLARC